MAVEILMPELGESIHEGTVSRWLKKVGEFVKEDEPIVEIMTDKVNTELPSPASGILTKILIEEGGTVEVFKAMGLIAEEGEGTAEAAPAKAETPAPAEVKSEPAAAEVVAPAASAPSNGERRWYTPVVRAIAKANNINEATLSTLSGTGAGGRVTKADIEAFLAGGGKSVASTPKAAALEAKPVAPTVAGPDQEIVPLVGMRKMIAEAMVRSSQVPTVSTMIFVDVTNMVAFRERNKESFQEQFGVKLTYTPFFLKAMAEALVEFPTVNSALMPDNQIVKNNAVHIGISVALGQKGDEGLIVPVLRDCHKKTVIEIAKDLENVAKRARNNQLSVSDVQGGTFTLTNPGSYGALFGTPMINAPQAAIAGVYAINKQPVVINDMIAIRSMMYLVMTYDHRLIDGLLAGKFLQRVKEKLESFDFFK